MGDGVKQGTWTGGGGRVHVCVCRMHVQGYTERACKGACVVCVYIHGEGRMEGMGTDSDI